MPSLELGRIAAFNGRPADGIEPLTTAIRRADEVDDSDARYEASWLLGVCQAAAGCYGAALAVLVPLAGDASSRSPQSPARPHYSALAATTIASIYRQLSMHTRAQSNDEWALSQSTGDQVVEFDGSIGMAADFVGQGDVESAREHWQRAARIIAPADWRAAVRLDWVGAEIALMTDRAARAVELGTRATAVSRLAAAPRHTAKSLLFAGVGALEVDRELAVVWLSEAAQLADELGAHPLVWPTRTLLASISPDPAAALLHRGIASRAMETILAGLPPSLATVWKREPEVARRLGSSNANEWPIENARRRSPRRKTLTAPPEDM